MSETPPTLAERLIDRLMPDIRGWATVGMFGLVWYDLHLIATYPELAKNDLFKTVSTLLLGSGAFGLVCAFLWGGSKASVSAVDTVNSMAKRAPIHPPGGSTTVTTTPAADVTVTPTP